MALDPHHLACLEAALDLALEAPRGPDGALTPEGKAHVQAALDQAEHDGPLHHWESMSEADWACFAASDWQPYTVTRGKNKGKQAWKHVKSGRISYEDPAAKEKERAGKEAAKARAKQEAAAKVKAAAAAKVKARQDAQAALAAKRKAAEAEKAKAAAAKAKAQEKAKGQRQQAAQHIRDVVSGSATTTPAKVRAAGAHLLNMTATELRALKSEIGAKGGGAAKAGLVAAITERALAARKAGKGKAAPAKPAKPVAKPKPAVKGAKPPAPPAATAATADPMAGHPLAGKSREEMVRDVQRDVHPTAGTNPRRYDPAGYPLGVDGPRLAREVGEVVAAASAKNPFDATPILDLYTKASAGHPGLTLQQFQASLVKMAKDGLINLRPYTQSLMALSPQQLASVIPLDMDAKFYVRPGPKAGAPAGPAAATDSLPADQQAALEKRKFTGTDRLGRKWVNGKLVAKEQGQEAGPGLTAAAPDNPLLRAMVAIEPQDFEHGALIGIKDLRAAMPGVPKEQLDRALLDLVERGVLIPHRHNFPDDPEKTALQGGKQGLVADGKGNYLVGFALDGRTPEGKAFGAAADPKFTGTDRLGRKWVNGELVAKEEKPPTPPAAPPSTADALRELQDARASTHHLPHQSMSLAELRDRLGLTDPQALDLARRLRAEQGVTAETRSGDLLGQNGVGDVVIPLQGVQPRHKAPATAEQVEAAVPKVEAAVREAAAALPPGGQVKISDLRRQLGLGRHEFDSAMHALRRAGKVKLDAISNLQRAKPGELADAIPGVNETLFYVEPVGSGEQSQGKGPDGHQEYTAGDGSKVRAPFYDQAAVPADFAIPGKPGLLGEAVAASEALRRQNFGVLNTADLYDALRAKHPDLDLHDFHRQLFAWQKQDLLVTQTTNDPEVLTPDQVAKSPAVKDMRGVPVLRGQLRFSARGQEEAKGGK